MGEVFERCESQEVLASSPSHEMDIDNSTTDDNTVYDPPVKRASLFKRSRMP